jgi:carboxyl-terminal processing protease
MNIQFKWRRYAYASALVMLAGFSSCKKSEYINPDLEGESPSIDGTRTQLTMDSIFLYAKEVYLWNDALPTYAKFNPRQYVGDFDTDLKNYESELYDITRFGVNPTTKLPYEYNGPTYPKYSYISDLTDQNPVAVITPKSQVNTDGVGYDLGIWSFAAIGTDNNFKLYVKAVSPGSPAAKVGFTRGTLVTHINGQAIGSNLANQKGIVNDLIEDKFSTAVLKGIKTDGSAFEVTLNRASYTSSPVYKSNIIEGNGKKVGYIALARFSRLTNPGANPSDTNLDPVFAKFAAEGLTDLIVDLRYNGGGYVSTAEYLINLIAPSTATGVMYTEVYNSLMQSQKATILKNQPLTDDNGEIRYGTDKKMLTYANVSYTIADNTATFAKKGGLTGIKNVVFIVSGGTASASELTINALKPFVNVKLVGTTTYGKPVGFFPVTIENKYDVYFSMFETRNSKNEGGYYAGFKPDVVDEYDDASRDFGDAAENYTKKSLGLLGITSATSSKATMSIEKSGRNVVSSRKSLGGIEAPSQFIGMVETRHKVK